MRVIGQPPHSPQPQLSRRIDAHPVTAQSAANASERRLLKFGDDMTRGPPGSLTGTSVAVRENFHTIRKVDDASRRACGLTSPDMGVRLSEVGCRALAFGRFVEEFGQELQAEKNRQDREQRVGPVFGQRNANGASKPAESQESGNNQQ